MKHIVQLEPGEKLIHTGDLIIDGNVGKGAIIDLKDGALTVNGNIDSDAQISVQISEGLRNKNTIGSLGIYSNSIIMEKAKNLLEPKLMAKRMPLKVIIHGQIGDNVYLFSDAEIQANTIGKQCIIVSAYGGITAKNDIAACCKLEAREDISVGGIGDRTQITSKQGQVKASNSAGHYIMIETRESVHLKDVGNHATIISYRDGVSIHNIGTNAAISAREDIDIDGTCPNPQSLNLVSEKGKVRRPKQAVVPIPKMNTNSYVSGSFENGLAMALKASEIPSYALASQTGLFSSTAAKPKIPHAYVCPITQELMKEPVIFIIDGNSYEKSEITEWLTKHRSSPLTREEMEAGQTIEQVLKPNRALLEAIEEFKKDNSESLKQNQFTL